MYDLISLMKIYNMKKFITVLSVFYFANVIHPTQVSSGIRREKVTFDYITGQIRSCGTPKCPATIKAKRENSLNNSCKLS